MDSFYHAIQTICVYAIPLIFAITLHESAHGWAAGRLGDPTATMLGRVTINPIPHIDPIGTIAVPGALLLMSALTGGGGLLFGWAKPVPINPRYFRNPLKAMDHGSGRTALQSLADDFLGALAQGARCRWVLRQIRDFCLCRGHFRESDADGLQPHPNSAFGRRPNCAGTAAASGRNGLRQD